MFSKRVAYVVNHVAFFVSHRLPLATGARKAGYGVSLFTGLPGSRQMELAAELKLAEAEVPHRRAVFSSSGMNPFFEILGLIQLIYFLARYRPQIVHCASPKGVLYGGIAARVCRAKGVVFAISGMGYGFTKAADSGWVRSLVRTVYRALANFAFGHKNGHVIVQNRDDFASMIEAGWASKEHLSLIPGSGVDLALYKDSDNVPKERIVLLPARMLRDKGVGEFVAAVRIAKDNVAGWRFILAGAAGYDNPSSISETELNAWENEGVIEWVGHIDDMVPLYSRAAIVCLPSYREGMPKALLEAAAAGCAIVTTDTTGCREAVAPGFTGDLVPVGDIDALAQCLIALIKDDARRLRYGLAGRERAVKMFSIESVVNQTLGIYRDLLEHE